MNPIKCSQADKVLHEVLHEVLHDVFGKTED